MAILDWVDLAAGGLMMLVGIPVALRGLFTDNKTLAALGAIVTLAGSAVFVGVEVF